jgi:hypothetical protein
VRTGACTGSDPRPTHAAPHLARVPACRADRAAFLATQQPDAAHAVVHRFLQEARAAAALAHPGVTVVHRVGIEAGNPYIAMEWLDGMTVEQLIAESRRFTVEQAARVGMQVLSALGAAHDAGIIHRDIKPGNLMMTRDGRVKITDFGIARVQGSTLAHTHAGTILGTPLYAAPEQLAGQAVDCRADLYSVGCVLYEAVTGRAPFEAATLYELIALTQTSEPAPPSAYASNVSPAFDAAVMAALARSPLQRYSSAREMAQAIRPFIGGRAATAPAAIPSVLSSVPTAPTVRTVEGEGASAFTLVMSAVRRWPATRLGLQNTRRLLDRLIERPLHAPALCGVLEVSGACLLACDGIIYGVFDPASGRVGDAVIDALPATLDATLYALPDGLEPRAIALLASLVLPPRIRTAGLASSYADLAQLARALGEEGFDGVLRFVRGPAVGFALFSKGRRILDLFGAGWPTSPSGQRWEEWVATSGAVASVEELQVAFPSITYRQQLRDLALDVVRPASAAASALRSDTVAEARALELRQRDTTAAQLRRGDATLRSLVEADPANAIARWALVELAPQFTQHGRAARWKALIQPLADVREVRLHHAVPRAGGERELFDVATFDDRGALRHVIERVAVGTRDVVEQFLARVSAVRLAHPELGGALLVAPRFEDDALDAYQRALRSKEGRSIFSSLDALTHREGFIRAGGRHGLHVLLVEEQTGQRRPLVFE